MTHGILRDDVVDCSEEVLKAKLQQLEAEQVHTQNSICQFLLIQSSIEAVKGELASKRAKTRDDPERSCYNYL
jgi:hypothetical protein